MTSSKKEALRSIPGISDEEVEKLEHFGIEKASQFQTVLDKDGAAALRDLSGETGIPPARVGQLLANSLQKSAKPITNAFWGDHWSDLAGILFVSMLLLECAWPWISTPRPRVVAASDIPAFSEIDRSQLRTEDAISQAQNDDFVRPFLGKYSLAPIHKGDLIPQKIASLQATDIANRPILRIPIKSMPPIDGRELPRKVQLIFPPGNQAEAAAAFPALLLGTEADAVTVVLDGADAKELNKRLGSHDVYLSITRP